MAQKKASSPGTLIRSDRNLLALGLLGTVALLGVMYVSAPMVVPVMNQQPQVVVNDMQLEAVEESFASEDVYPPEPFDSRYPVEMDFENE